MTNCILQRGQPCHTVLQGVLTKEQGHWWIKMSGETRSFPRPEPEMSGLYKVVDACAGIGAVATGYQFCGAEIVCHVDSNEQFHQWKSSRTQTPCILGDITKVSTIHAVAKHTPWSHTLSAGVSCQPFSRLGDGKQGNDPRSASLPGALLMGYFLGSLVLLLECTQEALTSEWVQNQMAAFANQLGYTFQQTTLTLHELWPAKRSRWWAVLAHPELCIRPIPRMPALHFEPSIIHVLRKLLTMPSDQLDQLALTQYELRQFYEAKGGIGRSIIDLYRAMPTATHSWGSQLIGCLGRCRSQGFNPERLELKGLYAVLVPLDHVEKWGSQELQAMRHPHPQEVAILNGLDPHHVQPTAQAPLRLELAGVGQLASPLQGAWVLSNVICQVAQNQCHQSDICPRHVIAQMCRSLLQARDEIWEVEGYTKPMKIFHQEIESLDRPWVFTDPDLITADTTPAHGPGTSALAGDTQLTKPHRGNQDGSASDHKSAGRASEPHCPARQQWCNAPSTLRVWGPNP